MKKIGGGIADENTVQFARSAIFHSSLRTCQIQFSSEFTACLRSGEREREGEVMMGTEGERQVMEEKRLRVIERDK